VVKAKRLRKIPANIRRAILRPLDPRGREPRGSAPANLVQREVWALFARYWVLADRVIACPAIGAPAAAMVAETLAASGMESLLLVGSCGGLAEKTNSGEVIRVEEAVSRCGTTAHYFPAETCFQATAGLSERIAAALAGHGVLTRPGKVVTTDAPFRETPAFLADCRQQGAVSIEMECAAVFAVARYRKFSAAAVLVVADRLKESKWDRAGLVKYALSMRRLLPVLWELDF